MKYTKFLHNKASVSSFLSEECSRTECEQGPLPPFIPWGLDTRWVGLGEGALEREVGAYPCPHLFQVSSASQYSSGNPCRAGANNRHCEIPQRAECRMGRS